MNSSEKRSIRKKTYELVDSGKIIKKDYCEKCNEKSKQLILHHIHYNEPIEVITLCNSCHAKTHCEIEPFKKPIIKNRKDVSLALSGETYKKIVTEADKNLCSISLVLRKIIAEYFKKQKES